MSFLRVNCDAARGLPAVPERDLQNMTGRKSIGDNSSNHNDARDQLFRIFPSGKKGTRRREHRVYWFSSSIIYLLVSNL